jgi:hypothetical protein
MVQQVVRDHAAGLLKQREAMAAAFERDRAKFLNDYLAKHPDALDELERRHEQERQKNRPMRLLGHGVVTGEPVWVPVDEEEE